MSKVVDGVEFLMHFLGGKDSIGKPVDLHNLPKKLREIERKYRLPGENGHIDSGLLEFTGSLAPFLRERKALIEQSSPFAGIDQYYVVTAADEFQVSFRFRIGANKLPELTAKFKLDERNEIRGEVNLDVSNNDPGSIQTMLTIVCKLAARHQEFAVRQDGNLWRIRDPEVGILEIVNYRVGGIHPEKASIALAEIESRELNDPEKAIRALEIYEAGLKLSSHRCEESIAELFGPLQT